MIILLLLLPVAAAFNNVVTGCNSRCSIVFDKDLDCLSKSLDFNTQVLFGTMRNYVSAQVNIKKLSQANNKVLPTKDQMVSQTVSHLSKVDPTDQSDEKDVLSSNQAEPIIEALIDNVEDLATGPFRDVYCPQGCEKPQSPWSVLFYVSLSVNAAFFAVGISSIFLTHWQDVRYAKKREQKSKETPIANGH